jgi:hypothetical protein
MKRGITLLEVMITIIMFTILIGVLGYMTRVILLSWSGQETRTGLDIILKRGMEETVRDLREARSVQSSNDEIRFTQDLTNYYIYYLYTANDSYPLAFSQSAYDLRKAALTGGLSGTFTYGSGRVVIMDVRPPPTSDLSLTSNLLTLDLSARQGSETVRIRTKIRPRNL